MADEKIIAATLAAAIIANMDRGSLPVEVAVDTYFHVLSVLAGKTVVVGGHDATDDNGLFGATSRKEIYHSENGDSWFLCRDPNGHAYVEHQANRPSGGKLTSIEIQNFLGNGRPGPEQRALIELIGNAVDTPKAVD